MEVHRGVRHKNPDVEVCLNNLTNLYCATIDCDEYKKKYCKQSIQVNLLEQFLT